MRTAKDTALKVKESREEKHKEHIDWQLILIEREIEAAMMNGEKEVDSISNGYYPSHMSSFSRGLPRQEKLAKEIVDILTSSGYLYEELVYTSKEGLIFRKTYTENYYRISWKD